MTPHYTEQVSLKFGRTFLKLHFGNRATIPHGSRCLWLAGVQYITDQPGVYLVGTTGGLQGVQILPPVVEELKAS